MGKLIEQQAVIDCLTNSAKYYELEDADEWTKGIHYGLLHGLDNILDDVPPVEAIPKADYEARLKADMVAMLTEIQLEIDELEVPLLYLAEDYEGGVLDCKKIIQQKINALKENTDDKNSEYKEPTTKNDLAVDCISRQEVLRLLANSIGKTNTYLQTEVLKMSSVTPQEPQTFKWCTDCKEYNQEKHCCHRWSTVIRDTVEEMKQEQEPFINKPCVSEKSCEHDKNVVLDKIRAEINKLQKMCDNNDLNLMAQYSAFGMALDIIDKYKAESEETDI